jgi:hypothetical protein
LQSDSSTTAVLLTHLFHGRFDEVQPFFICVKHQYGGWVLHLDDRLAPLSIAPVVVLEQEKDEDPFLAKGATLAQRFGFSNSTVERRRG